jgi:hypothetical protein
MMKIMLTRIRPASEANRSRVVDMAFLRAEQLEVLAILGAQAVPIGFPSLDRKGAASRPAPTTIAVLGVGRYHLIAALPRPSSAQVRDDHLDPGEFHDGRIEFAG